MIRWALGMVVAALLAAGMAFGAIAFHRLILPDVPAKGGGQPEVVTPSLPAGNEPETFTIERVSYHKPPASPDEFLTDDRLEDKKLVLFNPNLVDRRPLGPRGERLINASAAAIHLDSPMILPDAEKNLLTLHPSYARAIERNRYGRTILPSVNLIDGKAKQFDDGLYAALDEAYYLGMKGHLTSHIQLVKRLHDRIGPDGASAAYLAAGLELAGVEVATHDRSRKDQYLGSFRRDEVRSKPIGFYTWSESLQNCFRFMRYFQRPFTTDDELEMAREMAKALAEDAPLLADYRKAMGFYARLTNPYRYRSLADLQHNGPSPTMRLGEPLPNLGGLVAFFPASTSKETVLFERLFPMGLPTETNLMRELVTRIRSGQVDLTPGPQSGWYDHQVHALETLLLPERGDEHDKLVLTKAYKKRMLEAFQALMTKRRETHARQLDMAAPRSLERPPELEVKIKPRLRVEPNPTYYLRTARAYALLADMLEASVGADALKGLHGLREGGKRPADLWTELSQMRDLFYGLYLVSAEDIGLQPAFAAGEVVDQDRCYGVATAWLPTAFTDPDLAVDTRVAVPVFVDQERGIVRLWATLGVRMAKLEANYVRPPHLKPAKGEFAWEAVDARKLEGEHYLIPVDEFAEVELKGVRVLNRPEFRAICDREQTKEAIVKALQR